MDFAMMFGLTFWAGVFVSWWVYYYRAGFPRLKRHHDVHYLEFMIPNPLYFVLMYGKCLAWWAVLPVWVARGMPPSPWKAVVEHDGRGVRAVLRVRS